MLKKNKLLYFQFLRILRILCFLWACHLMPPGISVGGTATHPLFPLFWVSLVERFVFGDQPVEFRRSLSVVSDLSPDFDTVYVGTSTASASLDFMLRALRVGGVEDL